MKESKLGIMVVAGATLAVLTGIADAADVNVNLGPAPVVGQPSPPALVVQHQTSPSSDPTGRWLHRW